MPPRKLTQAAERYSLDDMFAVVSQKLLQQATEPNLLGYKPHAKQLEFHQSEAKGRWFLGGNRSGKSVGGVVEDLWWVTKRHPYKSIPSHMQIRGRVVGSDFRNGIETILFPIFKQWILPSDLVNGSWEDSYNKEEKTLYFHDGSFLEFRSCDQELVKHAGTSRHFIHFDEEPPKQYFLENRVRLLDTRGYWWLTMTPVEGMTWVYTDLYAKDPPYPETQLYIVEVESSENPYLDKSEIEEVFGEFDEDSRKAREKGVFTAKGGRVLSSYSEGVHFKLPASWRPPYDWTVYTSQDHGYRTPSAVAYNAVSPDGMKVVTFHEIYEKQLLVSQIAKMMKEFEATLEQPVYMRTGDPAMSQHNGITGTSILYEYAVNGIVIGTEGIPKDESIGIDRMNAYLSINPRTREPYWELTRACVKHNWEFKKLAWRTYASARLEDKNNPVEKVHDRDNHAFDANKYFFTFMRDLGVKSPERDVLSPSGSLLRTIEDMADVPNEKLWKPELPTRPKWEQEYSDNPYGWGYGD